MTDLREGWLIRDLTFGEVLAIMASRPRTADADLLFWNEDWTTWKGLDESECFPFQTARVESQSPPPVPLVPVFQDPIPQPSHPQAVHASTPPKAVAPASSPVKAVAPKPKSTSSKSSSTKKPDVPEVLAEAPPPPSLSDLLRSEKPKHLSINPEFMQKNPVDQETQAHINVTTVHSPPVNSQQGPPAPPAPTGPVVIPVPASQVHLTAPPPPPLVLQPAPVIEKPAPGFEKPAPKLPSVPPPSGKPKAAPIELSEDTTPPYDVEEELAAAHRDGSAASSEERPERTEITSVVPMDRSPKSPPVRQGGQVLRKFQRYQVQLPVIIQTTTEQFSTWSLDISEGGVRIRDELPDRFAGYSQVVLMPKNRTPFHLLASLVEDQQDGRFHLQFMDSPTQVEFITWLREQEWAKVS